MRALPIMVMLALCPVTLRSQADLPDIPDILRVTVDHSDGGVLIQWEPSTDTDIAFYSVYRQQDLVFIFLASVPAGTHEYKHMSPGGDDLAYAVTAIDSAGNESLFEQNVHKAVSATVVFDPCAPLNLLTWSAYQGWEGNISGYKIYSGAAGTSLQLITFVPSGTLAWPDTEIGIGNAYNYYVETVHTSGLTSLSDIETVSSSYPDAPQFLTVDFVTVLDRSTVELQFTADVNGPVTDFRVMKRSGSGAPYAEVTTIRNALQATQVIQDQFPTSAYSYEYIVQSVYQPDGCGTSIVLSQSNPGTSILLEYEVADQVVNLNWVAYEDYSQGLSGYVIQRRSGSGEFFDIQTVGPSTTSWSESIESVINGFQPGELQYQVLAIENSSGGTTPGISLSNIVTINVETSLRVPSAFTPGSNDMNFEFRPIIDFAPRKYLMMVMDRGGRKMFETKDPGEGWDGRFMNGEFVKEGVYVYYIQFTDYTGIFKSFTGNVAVLYP